MFAVEVTKTVKDVLDSEYSAIEEWIHECSGQYPEIGWTLVRAMDEQRARDQFKGAYWRTNYLFSGAISWKKYLERGGSEQKFLSDDYELTRS